MAEREQDEYKNVEFYAKNGKPVQAGFSKFQVGKDFYFCRYIDGDIAMLSQAYTSIAGRDNGIESVKKNEGQSKRYRYESRGTKGHGFALKAGNGQEIAISPDYASEGRAQQVSSRLTGGTQTSSTRRTAPTRKRVSTPKTKKVVPSKPTAKRAFSGDDNRVENYKPLAFYTRHGGTADGFNSFEKNGAYYFYYNEAEKVVLISESYTSKRGRDNGLESVKKNMKLKRAYQHHKHKNGKHYFDINAANKQEIATSRWYAQPNMALNAASRLRGEGAATRSASASRATPAARTTPTSRGSSEEQNYLPLAAYRKATKGKTKGFETFKGDDGEYYFTYFENGKLALISEGYPTAAIRDKGQASVEKNMKIESRYVYGKGESGQEGFILWAGNHKEIARSVGYGSAAAASVGAAYLIGTRRRAKPAPVKKTVAPVKAAKAKTAPTKKAATPVKSAKAKPVKKTPKSGAALAAGSVAAAGLGASAAASAKPAPVKKAAVPVKAAKAKPVQKKAVPVAPLVAGSVGVAGLSAAAAAAKFSAVKKAAVPVKAAAIKPAPVKATPVKPASAAAPIAAAALGTAAVAAAATKAVVPPKAKPIVAAAKPVVAAAAKPVAAAIPAGAQAAAAGGGGLWGWLKWLLLALLGLLAMLFLFKACLGGEKTVKVPAVATTTPAAAPAAMVTCWNGSKAKNNQACPTKITCWDNSFATQKSACPVQPVAKTYKCWNGSMALDKASCPAEVVAVAPVKKPTPKTNVTKMNAPSVDGRICGTSTNTLFNVTSPYPKSVSYLGSNPQFGESLSLTPDGFYRKLATAYQTSATDRMFLNMVATSLGYGSFSDMDASMFTNDTLANGTSGLLGFGAQHALQFSSLDVTDTSNLEAFKVRSVNGTDVHFMKRCGNFMYVCQP